MHEDNNSRYTVGLLIESVEGLGGFQSSIWTGIVDAAAEKGVNLICFAGGMLNYKNDMQRNVIYDFVSRDLLDGIIINKSITNSLNKKAIADFLKRFAGIPIVSIADTLSENIPCIRVDNEKSMGEIMDHVIAFHNRRRIAFIRGPVRNSEAKKRLGIYCRKLGQYGITKDKRLILKGDFRPQSGKLAVNALLDGDVEFDAVVAANDNMAITAIEALKGKKKVPEEVIVVGYDDIEGAASVNPPLTTVRQPRYEQGETALELIIEKIRNKAKGKESIDVDLPAILIPRLSCGCSNRRDRTRSFAAEGVLPASRFKEDFYNCLKINTVEAKNLFLFEMEKRLREYAEQNGELTGYQQKILELRHSVFSEFDDSEEKIRAGVLWDEIHLLITEIMQQLQIKKKLHAENQSALLRDISEALTTTIHKESLLNVFAKKLLLLDIRSCYIALYKPGAGTASLKGESELVFAYADKRRFKTKENKVYDSRLLFKKILSWYNGTYRIVVEPLYYHEDQIGFAVFEIGPREGIVYEALRSHISSALKVSFLFSQLKDERDMREKEMAGLNRELSKIAFSAVELTSCPTSADLSGMALDIIFREFNTDAALYIKENNKVKESRNLILRDTRPAEFGSLLKNTLVYKVDMDPFKSAQYENDKYLAIPVYSTNNAQEGCLLAYRRGSRDRVAEAFTETDKICLTLLANAIGFALKKIRTDNMFNTNK